MKKSRPIVVQCDHNGIRSAPDKPVTRAVQIKLNNVIVFDLFLFGTPKLVESAQDSMFEVFKSYSFKETMTSVLEDKLKVQTVISGEPAKVGKP